MKGVAKSALDAILSPIQGVINKATDLYNYVAGVLSSVWDAMKSAPRNRRSTRSWSPIQGVIDKAKDARTTTSAGPCRTSGTR